MNTMDAMAIHIFANAGDIPFPPFFDTIITNNDILFHAGATFMHE